MTNLNQSVKRLLDQFGGERPGIAIWITNNAGETTNASLGYANLETQSPITAATRFRIASLTKQFTVALATALEQDHKFSLEAEIGAYLSELSGVFAEIPIENLLRVNSGVRDFYETAYVCGAGRHAALSEEQLIDLINRGPDLNFSVGDAFKYSNTGFFLTGKAMERATGASLEDLMRTYLFTPAGMSDSCLLRADDAALEQVASPYVKRDGSWASPETGWPMAGQGGVVSTVTDLAKWKDWLTAKLTASEPWSRMVKPTRLNNGDTCSHGMGLFVRRLNDASIIYHTGALPGWRSLIAWSEHGSQSVCMLSNCDDFDFATVAEQAIQLTFASDRITPTAAMKPPRLEHGAYYCEDEETPARIDTSSGQLTIDFGFGPKETQYDPEKGAYWFPPRYAGQTIEPAPSGRAFTLKAPGATKRFEQNETASGAPSPSGSYQNDALSCLLSFTKEEEALLMTCTSPIGERQWVGERFCANRYRFVPQTDNNTDFPRPFVILCRIDGQDVELSTGMNTSLRFESVEAAE